MRFRKKPVVIDAYLYTGDNGEAIREWSNGKCIPSPVLEPGTSNVSGQYLQIHTLEGTMIANPGDWIIRGVQGEFYPVKDSIFRLTYEQAEDAGDTAAAPPLPPRMYEVTITRTFSMSEEARVTVTARTPPGAVAEAMKLYAHGNLDWEDDPDSWRVTDGPDYNVNV